MKLTIHEVRQIDDASRPAGVGVCERTCIAQLPAEEVGDDDDDAASGRCVAGWGRRARDVDVEAVEGGHGSGGGHVAAERAREAVVAGQRHVVVCDWVSGDD